MKPVFGCLLLWFCDASAALALPGSAGGAPASVPASCPAMLVTDALYGRPAHDVMVPSSLLSRLEVTQRWKLRLSGWEMRSVEIRFDGRTLASFGFGDTFTYNALSTFKHREQVTLGYRLPRESLLEDVARSWEAALNRARYVHAEVRLRLSSLPNKMPELLVSSAAQEGIHLSADDLRQFKIRRLPRKYASLVLMYLHGKLLAVHQFATHERAADFRTAVVLEIFYRRQRQQPLRLTVGAAPTVTFSVAQQ